MANKVGPLIKQARTDAKLTQEELAAKVDNVSASDISKAERGEKELSQTALKQIAKATGVTQKSLLEAAEKSTYGSSGSKKTSTSSSSSKKTSASSSSSKKTSTSSSKTSSSKKSDDDITLTKTEKQLVELYRAADSDTKKRAIAVLKGETSGSVIGDVGGDLLNSIISGAAELLTKK